ncbi:MAG: hypothetical protein AB1426_07870 [Bacillota bacterium]
MGDNIRRSGFFGGLFELLELASRLTDEKETIHREGRFGGKGIAGHWSVDVRLGTAGAAGRNLEQQKPSQATVKPIIHMLPHLEIHDEGEFLRVVVDFPYAAETAENFSVEGDLLVYDDPGQDVHYEWLLPCQVEPKPVKREFSHTLLVMDFKKAGKTDG